MDTICGMLPQASTILATCIINTQQHIVHHNGMHKPHYHPLQPAKARCL